MTIPFDKQPQLPVIVDLSLRDKSIFESWKKTFIYLRNFGAKTEDLDLDFSQLSTLERWQALHEFAFGEIEFRCKELEHSWTRLVCKLFSQSIQLQSILSESEES